MATKSKRKQTKTPATSRSQKSATKETTRLQRPKKVLPKKLEVIRPIVKQKNFINTVREVTQKTWFKRSYAYTALALLIGTTIYWTVLSAHLQNSNSDQLVDPYLFSSAAVFHGATFPGAHTFLFKWPIFWLVSVLGVSATSLTIVTVGVVLVTVLALAFILYRIDRRPLVFGTICLFLSLMLLLVPAQPYAGGLLPVNMAMLTTRNLEYILYIFGLFLLVRAGRFRSWYTLYAVVCLSLLIASDKLFLSLGIGGSLLMLVVYAVFRNGPLTRLAARWLCVTVVATAVATIGISVIESSGITHFANAASASPYATITNGKDGALGAFYAVYGFFTNLGANPAYDITTLRAIPSATLHRLFSATGLTYVVTISATLYSLYLLLWRMLRPSLRITLDDAEQAQPQKALGLSLMLFWTTVAAIGVFIVTKHYYAVDARYLTIGLFTIFIGVVTVLRARPIRPEVLSLLGAVLLLAIGLATFSAHDTYSRQKAALLPLEQRSDSIAQALSRHNVTVLAGDYWRVLPAKFASENKLTVMPFTGCTQPSKLLSSTAWQPYLGTHSFAYLLSLDGSLTDYPHCSLAEITKAYGRPNASLLVAGTVSQPKELLLFYDHGSHPNSKPTKQQPTATATVLPIGLDELMNTTCSAPTVMNVVAHQDDDLLFMSPDLLHDVKDGHCVRTVFLTAGDSGGNKFYWINRQLGSEAAYDSMLGKPNQVWVQRIIRLSDDAYITIANPKDNYKVSLVFFNLPDGNLQGDGFPSSHYESLSKLQNGKIAKVHSVDGQSSYTSEQLKTALSNLMSVFDPAVVRTQAEQMHGSRYPDHSDHVAVGDFTEAATLQYDEAHFENNITVPVKRYIGYPVHAMPENVFDSDLKEKEAAFLAYSAFDGGVCHTSQQCADTPTYGAYLGRQYQQSR